MLNPLLNSKQREWYQMLCKSLHSYQPPKESKQGNLYKDKAQNIGDNSDKGLSEKIN